MKNKFVSIFSTIILSITSFNAFAKTEIIWWDLLGGGDGVKMAAMVEAFEKENPDIDVADYNSKIVTNFMQEIADKYELSLRQIQRIASQYKDCYTGFLPSKK